MKSTPCFLFLYAWLGVTDALSNLSDGISRRDALAIVGGSASLVATSSPAKGAETETIDLAGIQAARSKAQPSLFGTLMEKPIREPLKAEAVNMDKISAARTSQFQQKSVVPIADPPPLLSINGNIKIPRIGYSFYKTPPEQAERCTMLALRTGIRHLDVASSYNSNAEIAKGLKPYLDVGIQGVKLDEKPELLELLDETYRGGMEHTQTSIGNSNSIVALSPPPMGSAGRRGRREGLFISHKLSNLEQSTDATSVRRTVKNAIGTLGCSYLDMISIHSPLTDKQRRLTTYDTLLGLKKSGFVKSVGVCNYGVGALQEILDADLELPAMNQLELSPFNAHKDIVDWCDKYGIAVSCSAWSKLSGASGPSEGWDALAKMAQQKGMTKAQILVRWAMQKGYACVPRSAAASKVERIAIAENSYGGVNLKPSFLLTKEELASFDGLDVSYKAGTLGRTDGWENADITGPDWDPTTYV